MKVYIAGPISDYFENQDYRKKIKKILRKHGFEYTCPLEMDYIHLGEDEAKRLSELDKAVTITELDKKLVRDIIDRDLEAISECDILLAYCPFPSYGTAMEIFYHSNVMNKTTIIFSTNPKSWLVGLGDYFVRDYKQLNKVIELLATKRRSQTQVSANV